MDVSMSLPLDSDGFARRECPNCEQTFKWRFDEEGEPEQHYEQYFCPLCGVPAGTDQWWTTEQVEHMQALAMPEAMRAVQDSLENMFKGAKGMTYKRGSGGSDLPTPNALYEPDDMVVVEPPCHPEEPLKVPEDSASPYHCLLCGSPFAV